ncbi:MAG: orotate phosphoribosyltransferase [Acetobacter sp.]|nr:orotate phosphoribosyltransferase [Acetobacter sp.]
MSFVENTLPPSTPSTKNIKNIKKTSWEHQAALETARILMEIKAINFRPEEPYTLTSGWKSPVYIDCRRIISFPRARSRLMDLASQKIGFHIGYESLDVIAGGETAGIPFAAWIAERLSLPMVYVRKKPKGFGRNAQIEGDVLTRKRTLLVEDLATDGGSKLHFVNALRHAEAVVNHSFVLFYYDVFPGSNQTLAEASITLHTLCTWHDVLEVCLTSSCFSKDTLTEIHNFLEQPCEWSARHGGIASLEEALAFKKNKDR